MQGPRAVRPGGAGWARAGPRAERTFGPAGTKRPWGPEGRKVRQKTANFLGAEKALGLEGPKAFWSQPFNFVRTEENAKGIEELTAYSNTSNHMSRLKD